MIGSYFLHLARYLLNLDVADTQTSAAEQECLARIVKGKNRVVEIGVYEGATTRLLAENMGISGNMFAVDPFTPGRFGVCWSKYIAKNEIKKSRREGDIELIVNFSHDAIRFVDGDFDMVFIDGDHSIDGISRDWADWSPRIRVGGVIALHDTRVPSYNQNVRTLGSYEYYESHIRYDERFELIEEIDSLSVLRRK